MRRLLFSLHLLGAVAGLGAADAVRPATPEETALFQAALNNTRQDTEHWAYTESSRMLASKGHSRGEDRLRFDPSKPYGEQFTPLLIDGKPPTERQLKQYRTRGEKRGERVAQAAEAARNAGATPPGPPQVRFGSSRVPVDIEHPRVVRTEGDRTIFAVPVLKSFREIPVDKFEILVTVNRTTRLVERVTLRILESFRLRVVAKIKAGEASVDFTVVDPAFPPVITTMTGNLDASVLFIGVTATFHRTRTEWQRVKSFDERLKVKLGPLQFQDF